MKTFKFRLEKISPYLFISIAGVLAFAPVSFMLFGLKNDILTIEYPIKYFISECIHNGEAPVWFNTWALGFPLQSNLTWGIFSTPQLIFSSVLSYNIYVLHFEFIFYVLLSCWSMFYLLKRHFLKDTQIALILACSYMLSGFVVGSSQWLLYITAASFTPLLLHALLQLLNFPSLRHAFLFAVIYYLMFTSVYQAFNIISSYCITGFTAYYLIKTWNIIAFRKKLLRYLLFASLFTIVLCLPCLYYTIEVLHYINRGEAITGNIKFFNSNYLPPASLSSILLPLSSVKNNFLNTEGTMFNCYMGLFTICILPSVILRVIRNKQWKDFSLLLVAIVFLLISFGNILPVRNWLNFLPGLSYFRNPGIFRFYFILFLILFLASSLKEKKLSDIIHFNKNVFKITILLLTIIFFIICLFQINKIRFPSDSLYNSIKNLSYADTIFLNSIIQLVILAFLLLFIRAKKYKWIKLLFIGDLIINTFLCTPYFTVSSYSLKEVDAQLKSVPGFPIQDQLVSDVPAMFKDKKNNTWYHINIFTKQISSNHSYWGPLVLKSFSLLKDDSSKVSMFNHPVVYTKNDANDTLRIIEQKPTLIKAKTNFQNADQVILLQNYFPGWKAKYNESYISLKKTGEGIQANVPPGKSELNFVYDKKIAWYLALLLHLIIICSLFVYSYQLLMRFFRSGKQVTKLPA